MIGWGLTATSDDAHADAISTLAVPFVSAPAGLGGVAGSAVMLTGPVGSLAGVMGLMRFDEVAALPGGMSGDVFVTPDEDRLVVPHDLVDAVAERARPGDVRAAGLAAQAIAEAMYELGRRRRR